MKKLLSAALLASLFMVGCSKSGSSPSVTPTNTDYQPTTAGSSWQFKDSASGGISTMTATSNTNVISGTTYVVFNSTSPGSSTVTPVYISKQNGFYDFIGLFSSATTTGGIDFRYLNDQLAVGGTWNFNAGGFSAGGYTIPAVISGKIIEKGITKTVNGVSFSNVIHSQITLKYDYSSFGTGQGLVSVGVYDLYAAKGVCFIKTQANLGSYVASTSLVSYTIK